MKHWILSLMLFATTALDAQYWTQLTDFPLPVYAPYGFSAGNRYYSGGGVTSVVPLNLVDTLLEYDPNLDQWLPRTPLPGLTRYGTRGFSIGSTGKGYVVCGWHNNVPQVPLNDLWEYDPGLDSWTQKATFPGFPRYSLVSIGTSTKAYAGLGYNPWTNDWYEYDPVADSWTQKTSFPGAVRQAANAFVLNDQVYVGMGTNSVVGSTAQFFNDMYRYDPASDTWTQASSLPALPRASSYHFSTCGIAYIIGGIGFDSLGVQSMFTDMWSYDAATDVWTALPDFPGTAMNTGTSFSVFTSGFMGFGGTGFQPGTWVTTGLTGEFWEYKGCGTTTPVDEAYDQDPSTWCDGLYIRSQWNEQRAFDRFALFDASGRTVRSGMVSSGQHSLTMAVNDLPAGVYALCLTDQRAMVTQRVMLVR